MSGKTVRFKIVNRVLNTILRISLLTLLSSAAANASEKTDMEIAERLKPVGEVCVEGQACATAAAPVASAEPRSGEEVYKAACSACHATATLNAPKPADMAAWQPRIDKGMEVLYANSINGFNGVMPPRGACGNCSDDELKAAVDFMITP